MGEPPTVERQPQPNLFGQGQHAPRRGRFTLEAPAAKRPTNDSRA